MRILSLTAGAANMYCGSCLRDNALARELRRQGHDVRLVPVYTPTKTDEPNASAGAKVLFGGISVYLQQHSALFRHTPWILDRLWDSRWALEAAARQSIAVDPAQLGELTVAMLDGEHGSLAKEFHKLHDWMQHAEPAEVVNIPNTLLITLAATIRRTHRGPVVCTLQGEDLFLDGLREPYRTCAIALIAERAKDIDAFVSVSDAYAGSMSRFLSLPRDRVHTVPLGIETALYDDAAANRSRGRDTIFRIGTMARVAPEKGLHLLAEAYREFRRRVDTPCLLEAAGYLAPEHEPYLLSVRHQMDEWGLGAEFHYHGELDLPAKVRYLASLDVFSLPAAYDEPKGIPVLEAMASGVPVALPDRGALGEHVRRCGGGLLCLPDDPRALAGLFEQLQRDPAEATRLGAEARDGVRRHASLEAMARQIAALYDNLITNHAVAGSA